MASPSPEDSPADEHSLEPQSSAPTSLEPQEPQETPSRYSVSEESSLLSTSHALKSKANTLFAASAFTEAISTYDQALASCPNYLDYELAVLHSNISACWLKLQEWKEAISSAGKALDGLERLLPTTTKDGADGRGNELVELEGENESEIAEALQRVELSDERRRQVDGLRAKSLLRRAKANVGMGGWGQLAAAETDYKALAAMGHVLPPADMRFVKQQLDVLPARIKEAQEREVGEMMAKLKELGNGLLKPFGLNTDMFNFVKDEKTGGYNMSFGNKE